MTLDSPRGWVHPAAVGTPLVDIFRPAPVSTAPAGERPTGRWEVYTRASRYVLDLDRCSVSRHNLDVADLAPGAVHSALRHDTEELTLLAVVECLVGRPMMLLLSVEPHGRIGTVRLTTNVRSYRRVAP